MSGLAEDVTEAKLATEHKAVLLAELQHRVRNVIAQIRVTTAQTAETEESVVNSSASMVGRLGTCARVQAILTRGAKVGVAIASIVQDEVSAQSRHEGQYALSGAHIVPSPRPSRY